MGLPGLGRLPIGDLDQDIGVIEHPVPGAAQEPVLTRSLRRDQALEHTPELVPLAGFGVPVMLASTVSRMTLRIVPLRLDQDG